MNKNKFYKGSVSDFGETKGYFIGQFMGRTGRAILETDEVEIAWKKISGDFDEKVPHYHRRGVEINIVISGTYRLEIEGKTLELKRGDFLVVYPEAKLKNLSVDEETEIIVVKAPSVADDKFDAAS